MSATRCRHYRRTLRVGAVACLAVYGGTVSAQTLGLAGFNEITTPFFGVPLTVLAMAAAGSLIGFAYTPPLESRQKLYTLAMANTVLAAWFVVLIPEWQGWTIKPVLLPPLAGLTAAANCIIVPMIFKRLPDFFTGLMDRVFNRTKP